MIKPCGARAAIAAGFAAYPFVMRETGASGRPGGSLEPF
jgi:hypothetical protein